MCVWVNDLNNWDSYYLCTYLVKRTRQSCLLLRTSNACACGKYLSSRVFLHPTTSPVAYNWIFSLADLVKYPVKSQSHAETVIELAGRESKARDPYCSLTADGLVSQELISLIAWQLAVCVCVFVCVVLSCVRWIERVEYVYLQFNNVSTCLFFLCLGVCICLCVCVGSVGVGRTRAFS